MARSCPGMLWLFVGVMAMLGSPSTGWSRMPELDRRCAIEAVTVVVDGHEGALRSLRAGSRLEVAFDVPEGCRDRLTLASFVAPAPAFDGSRLKDQVAHDRISGVFGPGRHSLAVSVYGFAAVDTASCETAREVARVTRAEVVASIRAEANADPALMARLKRELASKAHTGSSFVGRIDVPCSNGAGPPCNGCVGNADDKDPPGQEADGSDANAGYECDRNPGIGDGNPAHSACPNFQIDLAYRPALQGADGHKAHPSALIFGFFCVRTAGSCYLTDNTDERAISTLVATAMR